MLINNEMCIKFLKDELERNEQIHLVVHGESMFPTFKDGERVTVIKRKQYNIGDIVAYFRIVDDRLKIIVHRVVFKRHDYLLTKGDNNTFIDRAIIKNEFVFGVVVGSESQL